MLAIEVVKQRVVIVSECREHEIYSAVAIVIGGVDAHPGLGASLAVEGHAGVQANALKAPVPKVVIQEVRVRIIRDEQVHPSVIIVIGRHHAEAVSLSSIGQSMPISRLDELAVADILKEQVGLARKSGWPDHNVRPVAPDERPTRVHQRIPGRLDVARNVEVQIAVAVRVEERASCAPATGGHAGGGSHVRERAVATITE